MWKLNIEFFFFLLFLLFKCYFDINLLEKVKLKSVMYVLDDDELRVREDRK